VRVLLIHPEESQRDVIVQALGSRGFEVIAVGDTVAGMREFHRQNPRIVIVAHDPSVIDGEQFCALLRREYDVPVIVIGKDSSEATLLRVLRAGADAYLSYPSSMELAARIRALLRRTRPEGDETDGGNECGSSELRESLSHLIAVEPCSVSPLTISHEAGTGFGRAADDVRGEPLPPNSLHRYLCRLRRRLGLDTGGTCRGSPIGDLKTAVALLPDVDKELKGGPVLLWLQTQATIAGDPSCLAARSHRMAVSAVGMRVTGRRSSALCSKNGFSNIDRL